MITLRLAAAALLVLCGGCAGDAVCQHTRQRLEDLQNTIRLLRRIRQEVGCRQTDLNRLFQRLVRQGELAPPPACREFRQLCAPRSLAPQEAACFQACFSGLGRAEAEQECARLNFYVGRFETFLQEAQTASRPMLSLAHRLGVGAGLAAAIFFL